jgi:hypothetical protein
MKIYGGHLYLNVDAQEGDWFDCAHPECLFGIMSDSFITQVWTSLNHLEYEVIIHARLSLSAGKLSVYICVGYNLLLGLTVLVVVVFYMLSVYILVRYNICLNKATQLDRWFSGHYYVIRGVPSGGHLIWSCDNRRIIIYYYYNIITYLHLNFNLIACISWVRAIFSWFFYILEHHGFL